MRPMRKIASTVIVLLLLILSVRIVAQDSSAISVVGSGIVNSLVERLVEAEGMAALDIETMGSSAGIDQFCNGDIDLATAARAMSAAEAAICGANDVAYSEFIIGHHIVAFIAGQSAPSDCLSFGDLAELYKPSASNGEANWSDLGAEEQPLTLIIPQDNLIEYAIMDGLVAGDGLRSDIAVYDDPAQAVMQVSETVGSLAFIPWSDQLTSDETIAVLKIGSNGTVDCALPSAEAVETEQYKASQSLYLIVNRARLDASNDLEALLTYVLDESNAPAIEAVGATPPSSTTYKINIDLMAAADAAGLVTGAQSTFVAPTVLEGTVVIAGAANAFDVLNRVAERLTRQSNNLEIDLKLAGHSAGIGSLCSGEADIAMLDAQLSEDALSECENNGISTYPLPVGSQTTVLVGNAADTHTVCLTTDQINLIWRADAAEAVTVWSDLDDSFPEQPMTLFGLSVLDAHTDILLQTAGRLIPPVRRDTETDYDALYRAAAVGNVAGGLTYMSWTEYDEVRDNDQANIQLVAVDTGAGCMQPSSSNIENGSYPLNRSASLLVSEKSLADVNVQAFLWSLYDDENWPTVAREGFGGVSQIELPVIRRELETQFILAESKYPPMVESDEPETDDETAEAASE